MEVPILYPIVIQNQASITAERRERDDSNDNLPRWFRLPIKGLRRI
jgi:hypothetical protein